MEYLTSLIHALKKDPALDHALGAMVLPNVEDFKLDSLSK
jgi:hypothetical protein